MPSNNTVWLTSIGHPISKSVRILLERDRRWILKGKLWPLRAELVNTSVLEETEENKKSLKIVMFNSQESRVNRSQDLKKEKEGSFKNLGLVAAQCNGIFGLRLFFKNIYSTIHTLLYLTLHGL